MALLPAHTTGDRQDLDKNDTLGNLIKAGIVAGAGVAMYKTGALRELIKPMLEFGDEFATNHGIDVTSTMSSIKAWSSLGSVNTPERFQNYPRLDNSIFKGQSWIKRAGLIMDDIKSGSRHNINTMVSDSVTDIQMLRKMMGENREYFEKESVKKYWDTELVRGFGQLNNYFNINLANFEPEHAPQFRQKAIDEFLKEFSIDPAKGNQQLFRTGYRQMKLADVLEMTDDGLKQTNPAVNLNDADAGSSLQRIETFMSKNGIEWDTMKNLGLDSSIRIDEAGKVIDYRMGNEALSAFKRSLVTDFKLPVVQFNPIQMLKPQWASYESGKMANFVGMLSPDQIDPGLTGRVGRVTIGEALSEAFGDERYLQASVSVINGSAYVKDFDSGGLKKIADNLKLYKLDNADKFGISTTMNAQRQVANLPMGTIKEYTEEELAALPVNQQIRYKIGKWLDMGWGEAQIKTSIAEEHPGFDSITNVDEIINDAIRKMATKPMFRTNQFELPDDAFNELAGYEKLYNFKTVFGKGFDDVYSPVVEDYVEPHMFGTIKKGYGFWDSLKASLIKNEDGQLDINMKPIERYAHQFIAGRDDKFLSNDFTESSAKIYRMLNGVADSVGNVFPAMGFSLDSKTSSLDIVRNMLLKRALPIYMALQLPGQINLLSEQFFPRDDDGTGNRGNLGKFLSNNLLKPADQGLHIVKDFLGITSAAKSIDEYVPGMDQIWEMPGVYQLGLTQDFEERERYIEKGYDPIRKGRYWASGNTPFTGGKINYWRPNFYRRVEADVKFSDSKYGSRAEYYNNTWYPNLFNPLAPVNHFLLDKHHYDLKHYKDRPYMKTAPEGSQMPIIGPMFGATIGQIISPSMQMHREYWSTSDEAFSMRGQEQPSPLLTHGTDKPYSLWMRQREEARQQSQTDYFTFSNQLMRSKAGAQANMQYVRQSESLASRVVGVKYFSNAYPTPQGWQTPLEVYTTPSGGMQVVDVPDSRQLFSINHTLSKKSVQNIIGARTRIPSPEILDGGYNMATVPFRQTANGMGFAAGEQYNWITDLFGLRGFEARTFITGEANMNAKVLEDSSYAYSGTKEFWGMNLGGLGGNISEISRRFMIKRNNNVEYINPIRNTMPTYMPGSNYFTNFLHGDPYTKVENGEERLPGEGYERLNNITNLMDMPVDSRTIGKSRPEIVRTILKQDVSDDIYQRELAKRRQEVENTVRRNWRESGIAIDVGVRVDDPKNRVSGEYDALLLDPTSQTGTAIANVQATDEKTLRRLMLTRGALDENKQQVNYQLWATGNTDAKGYVHYVDQYNPRKTYTYGFDFDQGLLNKTLRNLEGAREDVERGLKQGKISRGDLYSDLDRVRILADVAPYSEEYTSAKAKVRWGNPSQEAKDELSEIDQRVKDQKNPLRVYPYKFKTSNLKTESVTVQKVLDNNTFITKEYGENHAIKFAGIHVSEAAGERYKDTRKSMAEVGARKVNSYLKPGRKVSISYDADEANKYAKDSLQTIRAIVTSNGRNVNRELIKHGLAKEKEDDDSPAAVNLRYSKAQRVFGSTMETLMHKASNIPIIGNKFLHVRSPYEEYVKEEVYNKNFKSWEHPIRDILLPNVDEWIGSPQNRGLTGIMLGGFVGSMFGRKGFGKLIGTAVGASTVAIGKMATRGKATDKRDWVPERRRKQEEMNEYVDILKYIKNTRLYEQYKKKALYEDNFDVDRYMGAQERKGRENKARRKDLTAFKKQVKVNYKDRNEYRFKTKERPKYYTNGDDQKQTVSEINKEIAELQGMRKVGKIPVNAMMAINYKQEAESTMYGYDPGENLSNIMSALPKKERQYYKELVKAPEEEKPKILRIAPSYLRRALQASWKLPVDRKPSLTEYFMDHGLPDENWIGWDESTDIEDVKVKLVHQEKLDPGEFDIWNDQRRSAQSVNIPVPEIHARNNPQATRFKLQKILGDNGFNDIVIRQTPRMNQWDNNHSVELKYDGRLAAENRLKEIDDIY